MKKVVSGVGMKHAVGFLAGVCLSVCAVAGVSQVPVKGAFGEPVVGISGDAWHGFGLRAKKKGCGCSAKRAVDPQVVVVEEVPYPSDVMPEVRQITFGSDVFFDVNQYELKDPALDLVADIVGGISGLTSIEQIVVIGYTDSSGSESYNQVLSERRAEAVSQMLIENGVDADVLVTLGKGEADPIASNDTAEGRSDNRRVEIEVVGFAQAGEVSEAVGVSE